MVVKTTVELPDDLAREIKALAKASDLNRQQYVRRVLENAAAKRVVFDSVENQMPAPQLELLAAEPPAEYGTGTSPTGN